MKLRARRALHVPDSPAAQDQETSKVRVIIGKHRCAVLYVLPALGIEPGDARGITDHDP